MSCSGIKLGAMQPTKGDVGYIFRGATVTVLVFSVGAVFPFSVSVPSEYPYTLSSSGAFVGAVTFTNGPKSTAFSPTRANECGIFNARLASEAASPLTLFTV
jgi:hypothetical protein